MCRKVPLNPSNQPTTIDIQWTETGWIKCLFRVTTTFATQTRIIVSSVKSYQTWTTILMRITTFKIITIINLRKRSLWSGLYELFQCVGLKKNAFVLILVSFCQNMMTNKFQSSTEFVVRQAYFFSTAFCTAVWLRTASKSWCTQYISPNEANTSHTWRALKYKNI